MRFHAVVAALAFGVFTSTASAAGWTAGSPQGGESWSLTFGFGTSGLWTILPGILTEDEINGVLNGMVPLTALLALAGLGRFGVSPRTKEARSTGPGQGT